jgi:hypothetical protein
MKHIANPHRAMEEKKEAQATNTTALVTRDAFWKSMNFSLNVRETTNIAAVSVKKDLAKSFVSA